jgi:hypothetical protein
VVRALAIHDTSLQAIPAMGIEIVGVTETTIRLGLRHQRSYGLEIRVPADLHPAS